jgi:nucleoside-diphosphate-sugar epimerase
VSRRVFVSGASGVLGRRAVPGLVAAGYTVTANVRNGEARRVAEGVGASAVTIDLFDREATARLGDTHDAVVHIATSIPTGASAGRRTGWAMNDQLRSDAAANLASAMATSGGRYVGESITFPYVDGGDEWINEAHPRSYFWGNQTCVDSEAASESVTRAGGDGVCLRFAIFFADDSAHVHLIRSLAKRGIFGPPGRPETLTSWIHIDDAASAVVAALGATPGVYNVAEPNPAPRSDHAAAIAIAVGRSRLRSLPSPIVWLGGQGITSLARAQRISSAALSDDTGWQPRRSVIDCWGA